MVDASRLAKNHASCLSIPLLESMKEMAVFPNATLQVSLFFFKEFYNLNNAQVILTSNFLDLTVPPFKIIVRSRALL